MPIPTVGLITCVKRDANGTITHLRIKSRTDDSSTIYPKSVVVHDLQQQGLKQPDLRPLWRENGEERFGPRVHQVAGLYVTTDPNDETRDNLGELPECK